ncbi:MAG TPA: 4-hydroxy-tetrahydrodipicolinate synthase [Sinomonas sp.]|nr:4-hydroxy-tetrahydrodipicolinate synthase [Sinomonas sp.]
MVGQVGGPIGRGAPFGELVVAMVTPFAEDGRVDFDGVLALADFLVNDGCDGLVVCGTAGESSTVSDREKEALFRLVKGSAGNRAKVIAGTGSNDTAHSAQLARVAASAGADGQMVVAPYFTRPTQDGIFHHFSHVAAATDVPVMVYDVPARAGIAIDTETIMRLADNPKIVALKDAKADFAAAVEVMTRTDLAVYAGDDALSLPWLAAGATGLVSVSAHAGPRRFRELIEAVNGSDLPRARRIQRDLAPLIDAVMGRMPGAVAAKQVLKRRGILPSSTVRLPLVEPTEAAAAELFDDIVAAELAFAS